MVKMMLVVNKKTSLSIYSAISKIAEIQHEFLLLFHQSVTNGASLVARPAGKESAFNAADPGSIPELGRFPGEENGSCLENVSILALRIPRTEEPGRIRPWGRKELDTTEVTNTFTSRV